MLLLALLPLPYGYYNLLRLVVSATTGYLAYEEYERRGRMNVWTVGFTPMAILFNPMVPITLDRSMWAPIDVVAACLLFLHRRNIKAAARDAS